MYNKLLTNKTEVIAPSSLKTQIILTTNIPFCHHDRDQGNCQIEWKWVSSMIYYPVSLHEQPAFIQSLQNKGHFPETERACHEVLSLPIYPDILHNKYIKL